MSYTTIILQLCILVNIIYFYCSTSYFILWINLGLYLFIKGLYLLNMGGDLFSGFLWIVDYNLGFIFLLFGLHYMRFLYQTDLNNSLNLFIISWSIGLILLFNFYIAGYITQPATQELVSIYFYIKNIDFYELFTTQLFSNLYIYYLIYFKLNVFEFIIINILLFLGIIIALNIYWNIKLYVLMSLKKNKSVNKQLFMKMQNYNSQKYASNNIFKVFAHGSKTNIFTNYW